MWHSNLIWTSIFWNEGQPSKKTSVINHIQSKGQSERWNMNIVLWPKYLPLSCQMQIFLQFKNCKKLDGWWKRNVTFWKLDCILDLFIQLFWVTFPMDYYQFNVHCIHGIMLYTSYGKLIKFSDFLSLSNRVWNDLFNAVRHHSKCVRHPVFLYAFSMPVIQKINEVGGSD